jgi:hypothetical protein
MEEQDGRNSMEWLYSFSAAMIPFAAFCFGHSKGMTVRVVEGVVRSPVGVYGLFALPFVTLGMEKSIYDTVQAWQGIDPNVRPKDRGGFPSGGAGTYSVLGSAISVESKFSGFIFLHNWMKISFLMTELPSFSLIPIQKKAFQKNHAADATKAATTTE